LEQGGIPSTLAPYLPVPFYYHYGFHAIAAVFSFWSGLAPEQAVLVIGQVLSAAIGLSIYRLGMEIWSDVRRAGAAALLATFAFHMPAYYLTWGRYPLTAGLVVLPLVVAAALSVARQAHPDKESIARLALLTGGLFLTHYLTAIILALFLIPLGVSMAVRDLRLRSLSRAQWTGLLVGVAAGCVLAFPWLLRIYHFNAQNFRVSAVLSPGAPDQAYYPDYLSYLWYLAGPRRNYFMLLLAGLGLLLAIRRRESRLLAAWAVLMLAFCSPWGLELGPFRPDHMVIVLFLPGSLLAADLLVSASEAAGRVLGRNWNRLAAPLVILGLCTWGALETANILNPSTILADAADVKAIAWVKASTPPDARFFINAAAWQGSVYRGVDGGWWLLPLAGRWTVVPPVVYTWGTPEYIDQVNAWATQASQVTGCSAEFWDLVKSAGISYVYLHLGKGALQPQGLEQCPGLQAVYQSGGVWIYQILAMP
ncbi:MAG: hypothetical protein M1281_17965, partial [Chloroflexi bacterium]|nr:hypothetical protein [Chloroflexota bacterium]